MRWPLRQLGSMLQPRVMHRLPGRLRLHVSALRRLPEAHRALVELLEAVLTVPLEIRSARVTPATGSLLLVFDAGAVEEEDVLRYVRGIARLFGRHGRRIAGLSPEEIAAQQGRWIALVKSALRYRLDIDPDVEIAEHALA